MFKSIKIRFDSMLVFSSTYYLKIYIDTLNKDVNFKQSQVILPKTPAADDSAQLRRDPEAHVATFETIEEFGNILHAVSNETSSKV